MMKNGVCVLGDKENKHCIVGGRQMKNDFRSQATQILKRLRLFIWRGRLGVWVPGVGWGEGHMFGVWG